MYLATSSILYVIVYWSNNRITEALDLSKINKNLRVESLIKNKNCMQDYLYCHFESEGYNSFLEDMSIILIDKTDDSDPTKRETFWMYPYKHTA